MTCKCKTATILDTPIQFDYKDTTLRILFKELLSGVLHEADSFSGKRALWDSDWQTQIAMGLIRANLMEGEIIEDDGYEDPDFDWDEFHKVTDKAIEAL